MLQSNLSSYSTSFRNSNNNNSSTKQDSEMKANNSNYDYQAETVRSRQNVTPKKSPFQKNRSVANDFALTVIENSTKLRGIYNLFYEIFCCCCQLLSGIIHMIVIFF